MRDDRSDRDLELGAALRALPTPDHGPGFWDDLEQRLAEGDAGDPLEVGAPRHGRRRSHRRRPRPSTGLWLLSAAAAVAVLVTTVAVLRPREGDDRVATAPPTSVPAGPQGSVRAEPQGWSPLFRSVLGPRRGHVAVWTGTQMIVWGGRDFDSPFNDGASYDPAADRWMPLPAAPLAGGDGYTAVWTGTTMIVFGSVLSGPGTNERLTNEGAVYDPASADWRKIARAPLTGRAGHTAVWTGDRMLVWGGSGLAEGTFADGAAYDPATDRWTAIPPAPIGGREGHVAVWTGSKMVVWGGSCCEEGGEEPSAPDGAAFDPATRTWERVPDAPLRSTLEHAAVWTGDPAPGRPGATVPQMIVAGGLSPNGAAYEPVARRWAALPDAGLDARMRVSAVWTGSEVLVWGGEGAGGSYADGAAYDPVRGSWERMVDAPISRRGGHTAVWTGTVMLVWGGGDGNQAFFGDGAAYRPGS